MKELSKIYDPQKTEDNIYEKWEKSGYFQPEAGQPWVDNPEKREPFSILMPPPNVTGVLHLGHAMENTLMDIMARYQRMQGKKVLLLPGTDHAAVATQAKVEKLLIEKGIENPRQELGREKLLKEIKKFAGDSQKTIISQTRKMGTSCDWNRLAYTFDKERSRAVNEMFAKMYEDGLIYRGHRVVNWSAKGQSTCSDDELEYKERKTKLYTFKYSEDFPISIATTRPETKLGDTAVAVNSKDKRHKKYIGRTFEVKNFAESGIDLKIKIIADESIAPDFGTGAVGVTPAHSMADFEMYEKQKAKNDPIEIIQVIGQDGKMNANAEKYAKLSINETREKIIENLKQNNLLEKEGEITHSVGTSDRFGDIAEVLPMTQWFVAVNKKIPGKNKTLKELMKEAIAAGLNNDPKQKVNITPQRFEKIYFNWIDSLRDWCISRQIWWGHRIPVWYCEKCSGIEIFARSYKNDAELEKKSKIERYSDWHKRLGSDVPFIVSEKKPTHCPNCNCEDLYQDPDTLDTWFSSGLWTFSTLGWPNNFKDNKKTSDLKNFHPTSWMQMGSELLFFWMARMILMSAYALNEIPFRKVYIHGILRDEKGNKFSKSSGNNIDPLGMIEKYGTDALRLSLVSGITPGQDSHFYEEKVESFRNFTNKLWNINRYIYQHYFNHAFPNKKNISRKITEDTEADKWIINKFIELIKKTKKDIEKHRFSQAGVRLKNFTLNDFADWYLEISKLETTSNKGMLLRTISNDLIRMWHPFIPFVTESIWESRQENEQKLLMIEKWPMINTYENIIDGKENFDLIKEIIIAIRNIRAESKISAGKKIKVIIQTDKKIATLIKENEILIKNLRTHIEELEITESGKKPKNSAHRFVAGVNVYVPLAGLIDTEKEKTKNKKELDNLKKYAGRLEEKLKNKNFIEKAPEKIVRREKENLKKANIKIRNVEKCLKGLD